MRQQYCLNVAEIRESALRYRAGEVTCSEYINNVAGKLLPLVVACHSAVLRGYFATCLSCLARWSSKTACVGSVLSPPQTHTPFYRSFITVDIFKLCKFRYGRPRECTESHYILPRVLSFFRMPSSVITTRNFTKLCHSFGSEQDLKMVVRNLGSLRLKRGLKLPIFG